MLNVDIKKSSDNAVPKNHSDIVNIAEHSDDELRRSHTNYAKEKELILPKVTGSRTDNGNLNVSADNIVIDDAGQNQPKM
jgi:hypothetical protein